jgi:hypothetical protein
MRTWFFRAFAADRENPSMGLWRRYVPCCTYPESEPFEMALGRAAKGEQNTQAVDKGFPLCQNSILRCTTQRNAMKTASRDAGAVFGGLNKVDAL